MAKAKVTSELKTASKSIPVKAGEKVPPKKRSPKPNNDNILQPSFKKHCSYCGKPSTHAQALIAGPPPLYPYICDECVEVCLKILMEGDMQGWRNRLIGILAKPAENKGMSPNQSETKPRSKKKVEKSNA